MSFYFLFVSLALVYISKPKYLSILANNQQQNSCGKRLDRCCVSNDTMGSCFDPGTKCYDARDEEGRQYGKYFCYLLKDVCGGRNSPCCNNNYNLSSGCDQGLICVEGYSPWGTGICEKPKVAIKPTVSPTPSRKFKLSPKSSTRCGGINEQCCGGIGEKNRCDFGYCTWTNPGNSWDGAGTKKQICSNTRPYLFLTGIKSAGGSDGKKWYTTFKFNTNTVGQFYRIIVDCDNGKPTIKIPIMYSNFENESSFTCEYIINNNSKEMEKITVDAIIQEEPGYDFKPAKYSFVYPQ